MTVLRWTGMLLFTVLTIVGGHFHLPDGHAADSGSTAKAYFAGGCFWCMEEAFEKVDGVIETVSGYMGGTVKNPTYEEVSAGQTGHAESRSEEHTSELQSRRDLVCRRLLEKINKKITVRIDTLTIVSSPA